VAPAADEVEGRGHLFGAYGDGPLDVAAGVVKPVGQYVITDGASYYGEYKAGQQFAQWYGKYGAEHHMRPGSIARSFQCIPGEDTPQDRADRMVKDLQRQSETSASPVGLLWDSFDPRGRPEPASLSKEVGDSAETAYHNEMHVTPKMVHRWKKIH
jgi:hypothetical protein